MGLPLYLLANPAPNSQQLMVPFLGPEVAGQCYNFNGEGGGLFVNLRKTGWPARS
jgi:hypothetical protein